jgi:hypothetical protein
MAKNAKISISLVFFFGITFIQAQGLVVQRTCQIKHQQLYYYRVNNRNLQTLSEDSWALGTGHFSESTSRSVASEEFIDTETVTSDSVKTITRYRYCIGLGYCSGLADRGVLSRLLSAGEIDPLNGCYLNNQIHINFSFLINEMLFAKVLGSYIWATIGETGSLQRSSNGHFWPGNNDWEFTGQACGFCLGRFLTQNEVTFVEAGLEYYLWSGSCIGYEVVADTFIPDSISSVGNGLCVRFGVGVNKRILGNLMCNLNLIGRYSVGKEKSLEDVVTPIVFHLTGIYVELGVKYVFR